MKLILLLFLIALISAQSLWAKDSRKFIGGGNYGWKDWLADDCWSLTDRERGGNLFSSYSHYESTEEGMGSLKSPVFTVTGTHLCINCGGWEGTAVHPSVFMLRKAQDDTVVRHYLPGNTGNDMSSVKWNIAELLGEEVYFEACDQYSADGYAWLQLAAVYMTSEGEADSSKAYLPLTTQNDAGSWIIKDGYLTFEGNKTADCRIISPAFPASDKLTLSIRGYDGVKKNEEEDEFKFSSGFNAWYDKKGLEGTVCLEVFEAVSGRLIGRIGTPDSDTPQTVDIDTAQYKGKHICISMTDSSNNYWIGLDRIEAGDFIVDFSSDSIDSWKTSAAGSYLSDQEGIPFTVSYQNAVLGSKVFDAGFRADTLYILGLDHCEDAWNWLGDTMGSIKVSYSDGTEDIYPVILGINCWWGQKFQTYIQPFSRGQHRKIFTDTFRLYPQGPSERGTYVSVINTDSSKELASVTVSSNPETASHFNVLGMTAAVAPGTAGSMTGLKISEDFAAFAAKMPLLKEGSTAQMQAQTSALSDIMYATENSFPKDFVIERPKDYKGPIVEFEGDSWARLMSNVFSHNALDMSRKVTDDGKYHTSTYGAPWYGYDGVGLYTDEPENGRRNHAGHYFDEAWTRDEGRCLCELIYLGYYDKAKDCAKWTLDMGRSWERHPEIKFNGSSLPPHIMRILQRNDVYIGGGCFENDGHGQVATYLYNMWRRMPIEERKQWEKDNWDDIKYMGDWPQWQLDHPEISNATENLWSDSEGSGWDITVGYSIFCDLAQVEGLIGLSRIAASAGHDKEAKEWLTTAQNLKKAIEKNYTTEDEKYGKIWTMKYCGFGGSSTLAPILFSTDRTGFDIANAYPEWAQQNKAAWQRTLDNYRPNAFGYGQGYMLISTLMYDEMEKAEELLRISGRCLYNPTYEPYIVPENVFYTPDFSKTARMGDLGNCVQQAEMVKALRIMGGIDDNDQENIFLMPRLPKGWSGIKVEDMPIVWSENGRITKSQISYTFRRSGSQGTLDIIFKGKAMPLSIRLGAFDEDITKIIVNGKSCEFVQSESGDSKWAHLKYNP